MYTIPKQLITDWDNIKNERIAGIDKVATTNMITAQDKAKARAEQTKLFAEFD